MYFDKLNTIVIKIGSSLIIDEKKKIRSKWLDSFVKDIQGFKKAGKRIIIVSSGAIALGCKKLNLDKKNLKIDKSQAVASIGQIELMNLLKKNFSKKKILSGKIKKKIYDLSTFDKSKISKIKSKLLEYVF